MILILFTPHKCDQSPLKMLCVSPFKSKYLYLVVSTFYLLKWKRTYNWHILGLSVFCESNYKHRSEIFGLLTIVPAYIINIIFLFSFQQAWYVQILIDLVGIITGYTVSELSVEMTLERYSIMPVVYLRLLAFLVAHLTSFFVV